jgi:hypothetical protein
MRIRVYQLLLPHHTVFIISPKWTDLADHRVITPPSARAIRIRIRHASPEAPSLRTTSMRRPRRFFMGAIFSASLSPSLPKSMASFPGTRNGS